MNKLRFTKFVNILLRKDFVAYDSMPVLGILKPTRVMLAIIVLSFSELASQYIKQNNVVKA